MAETRIEVIVGEYCSGCIFCKGICELYGEPLTDDGTDRIRLDKCQKENNPLTIKQS